MKGYDWISVNDQLPEDKQIVLVCYKNDHVYNPQICVMEFWKGRTKEQLSEYSAIYFCDENGNNMKPYAWKCLHSHFALFGQDATHWMPLPDLPKEWQNRN